jgi:hypothetical protein
MQRATPTFESTTCRSFWRGRSRGRAARAETRHQEVDMRALRTLFALWWVAMVWGGVCADALAAPQTGWWWNPDESGRGFFVESHDGVTFIGAYSYDIDGHATWLVAGGPNDDSYNYTGDLYNKTGGQTLFGSYVAPGNAVVVGQISVHFSDDTHGTVTWPGGTVQIERQIFGTGDAPFQPDNGWWWNSDESGSGYSLEVQGGNLFVVGFMYDDTGRPVWYYSAGPMTDPTTYHGDVLQFANGQTMGGAYHPPGSPIRIATLDIEFTATDEATLTFTEATARAEKTARAKAGGSSNKSLRPQFPKVSRYQPPAAFGGYFSVNSITHDTSTPGLIYDAQHTVRLDFGWKIPVGIPVGPFPNGEIGAGYLVDYSNATITVTFNATAVESAGKCTQTASLTLPLGGGKADSLSVTISRKYYLTMLVDFGDLLPVTQTCEFSDGSTVTTVFPLPLADVTFNYQGVVVGNTVAGGGTKTVSEGLAKTTSHYEWSFIGK